MAVQTFLELVNNAIDESKVSLDALTSTNFASPPRTVMYNRFKRWVNMAYRELMMKRKEWHFRTERATVSIYPRLHLSGLTSTPSVGDILEGDSSGVIFTVVAVHAHEDVEQDTTTEATVSVTFDADSTPSNLLIREQLNRNNNTPAANVGYLKGWGTYDMRPLVNQLESIDLKTVRLHHTPANAVTGDGTFTNNTLALIPLTSEQWLAEYEQYPWNDTHPRYIRETSQGTYDFYPKPDQEYILSFDFQRMIPALVDYDDTPDGLPEEYHDYLMWRAVQEFADFDNQTALFSRARKHVEEYLMWLDRDEKPVPVVGASKFRV